MKIDRLSHLRRGVPLTVSVHNYSCLSSFPTCAKGVTNGNLRVF